ncbi:hypothetical protein BB561_006781 [Smittium simulii]|uniref:Farnesyl diphosphate synthase n=1 Tax=Smittium simulii TaxID=133385 RepID=A0A2T9Y1K7_9FUNG|nr:hypothetical protein BB561_006781 [Smittium simulii]
MDSESSYNAFTSYYPRLELDIKNDLLNFEATPEMIERILPGTDFNDSLQEQAIILGWCVELLQAFFLVADDIMDDSPMRRGKPSWFKTPGIGMIAINDSFIIEAVIYRLIKKHFRSASYYIDLVELFQEVTFQTELGQMVDLTTAPEHVDLSKFSIENHTFIVKYKTAFYSFYLPVALSFLICNMDSINPAFAIAKEILVPMGVYFQVQDDYLDLYGDVNITGKVGTDIEDNKCSWLVIKALEICTPEQRSVIETHYGRKSSSDIAIVKQVYDQIDLKSVYLSYSAETELKLSNQIKNIDPSIVNPQVFEIFLKKISNRQK